MKFHNVIFTLTFILISKLLTAQEISDIFLNQALNVRIESVQMDLLDQLMLETGLVFPVQTRPITHREWYTFVSQTLERTDVSFSASLRKKLETYIPNFKFRDMWHMETFARIGLETVKKSDNSNPFIERYEDRIPLARLSYQASRDTAFGFSIQLKLQNSWPIYTTTNNQTNIPHDVFEDLDLRVFHRAYISYQTKRITIQFGRDNLNWGVGERGSTFLSDNVPYFDFIKFVLWFEKVKFSMAFVSLTDYEPQGGKTEISQFDQPERNMMLQRIEWRIFPSLSISTSYMKIIFGRPPKIGDINPFIWQHNLFKDYQNSMASADFVWGIVPGLQLYGEVTSDEIQAGNLDKTDNKKAFTAVSYLLGSRFYFMGFNADFEYIYLAPLMYNFAFSEGRAVELDGVDYSRTPERDIYTRALGHWLPTDSKNLYGSVEKEIFDDLKIKGIAEQRLKGSINLTDPYPTSLIESNSSPTGIIQTTNILGLQFKYLTQKFDIRLMFSKFSIENYQNIEGINKNGFEFQTSVSYRLF